MAKEIERSGIPVAYITTLTSLAEEIRANRMRNAHTRYDAVGANFLRK